MQLDVGHAFVVGIDIEPREIAVNGHIGEALVGDIQRYPLPTDSFDAAICWNVLEHLERPDRALENLQQALRVGGLLVINVPHLRGLKTHLVKLTPRWLHRRIWHWLYPRAGADEGPFPLVLSDDIAVTELERFASRRAMAVVCTRGYESTMQANLRERLHIGDRVWALLHTVCAGRIDVLHSDRLVILRKH